MGTTHIYIYIYIMSRYHHDSPWPILDTHLYCPSLLIAAQNNDIRTNHIKARIDKTQQNSKCCLYGDRDETINHIINKCSKLKQKEYKTRHGWVGKWYTIMCKKFKFDHRNKWYMDNPASVLENDRPNLLWDFDIHTDHLISARWPDVIIIKKKKKKRICKIVDFAVPADHKIKLNECEKKDKYLNIARYWKNHGTCGWQLYKLWLVLLTQ